MNVVLSYSNASDPPSTKEKKSQLFDYPKTLLAADSVGDGASGAKCENQGSDTNFATSECGNFCLVRYIVGNKVYLKVYKLNQLK